MRFMNEWDIEESRQRFQDHPILGPATETLENLKEWTNRNSDGWPYWPKPARAAARLMELIERDGTARYLRSEDRDDATEAELRAALRPIKAFRTRHGADFEIVETLDVHPTTTIAETVDAFNDRRYQLELTGAEVVVLARLALAELESREETASPAIRTLNEKAQEIRAQSMHDRDAFYAQS